MWDRNTIVQEGSLFLQPQQINNSMIMEDLMKRGFKGSELEELNRLQYYMKSTTLSGIENGDGITI